MVTAANFDAWLEADSSRFLAAVEAADPAAPVPTCPDWRADDLLWPLGEVQAYWATIVLDGLTDADQVERISPSRPDDREGLVDSFRHAHGDLHRALSGADDATAVWTWSEDRTVGFIRRRQAHEATVSATAADLDCWLWHRPPLADIRRVGGADPLRSFDSVVSQPID